MKMDALTEAIKMLGYKGKDRVLSGRKGTITSISQDLNGCVQVLMVPSEKSGKKSFWIDICRVRTIGKRIMEPIVPKQYIPPGPESNKPTS